MVEVEVEAAAGAVVVVDAEAAVEEASLHPTLLLSVAAVGKKAGNVYKKTTSHSTRLFSTVWVPHCRIKLLRHGSRYHIELIVTLVQTELES